MEEREESDEEENANMLVHAFGTLLCLAGIPFLIIHAKQTSTPVLVGAVCLFSFGLLMVYLSSTLYHLMQDKVIKHRMRIWDHVSIFFLIAGTHTPIVLKYIDHSTALIFLSIMWTIVVIGSVMKIFYTGKMRIFSILLYLALGYMSVFIIKPIITNMPNEIFWWILGGGLAYTSGVVFYIWEKLKYHHAIWHCFVLAGTIAHFFAIYFSLPVQVKF